MTDLLPCPFCGGEGREVGGSVSSSCSACGSYGPEEVRCVQCNASAVDAEDWNTRPVPELPEKTQYCPICVARERESRELPKGYRVNGNDLQREDAGRWVTIAFFGPDGSFVTLLVKYGRQDAQALAIWLGRRSK